MQAIRPNAQDGSGYPPSGKEVLCRYIDNEDRCNDEYYLLTWDGVELWQHKSLKHVQFPTPDEWVWVESAFETYSGY